ncbi:MAG: riboflavin biosynthesis protein RibF [Bacteroidales bacterium]|nr:riboflavin biosynthesis protein RibF [Bacteroidales bacterium]
MSIATIGFFDGVHLGHRRVIETLVSRARETGREAVVVTFWPHPRAVLQQDARDLRLLTTLEEKKQMLQSLGVDRVEVLPFNRKLASLTAQQFVDDILINNIGIDTLVAGYDNKIGSDGTPVMQIRGLEIICTDEVSSKEHISSTVIRKKLEEGKVEDAAEMLGYGYALKGVVGAGNRLGRTLGYPTANMRLYEPLKLVPGHGVYAVDVEVLGREYKGMTNIGTRPTVGGQSVTVETHILDFDEDIYGLPLTIRFRRRIRDEIHFSSLDALKAQLALDALNCKK